MRTLLQGSIILLIVALIVASWVLALAHQLDWGGAECGAVCVPAGFAAGGLHHCRRVRVPRGPGVVVAVFQK